MTVALKGMEPSTGQRVVGTLSRHSTTADRDGMQSSDFCLREAEFLHGDSTRAIRHDVSGAGTNPRDGFDAIDVCVRARSEHDLRHIGRYQNPQTGVRPGIGYRTLRRRSRGSPVSSLAGGFEQNPAAVIAACSLGSRQTTNTDEHECRKRGKNQIAHDAPTLLCHSHVAVSKKLFPSRPRGYSPTRSCAELTAKNACFYAG